MKKAAILSAALLGWPFAHAWAASGATHAKIQQKAAKPKKAGLVAEKKSERPSPEPARAAPSDEERGGKVF